MTSFGRCTGVGQGASFFFSVGESWGMANGGEWQTGQYLVEGVKVIKCFHPRMVTLPMARVNTN